MYNSVVAECQMAVRWGGIGKKPTITSLPCYSDEVQESISASWASQQVVGRTGSLHSYTGTADVSYSFSFDLHRDMQDTFGCPSIEYIIMLIKASCYPSYRAFLQPPRTTWKFGQMYISGIMETATFAWKTPIIEQKYAICTVNVQMRSAHTSIIDKDDLLSEQNVISALGTTPSSEWISQ